MMITSNIAFYPCINLIDTDDFYAGLIGLEMVFSDESSRIYSTGRGYFGFVQYPDRQAASGHLCLSLNCPDRDAVDAQYRRILDAGGQPEGQPKCHPGHPVYSFFLKDPNGYLVEFQKIDGIQL